MVDNRSFLPLHFFREYTYLRGFITLRDCGDLSQPEIQKKFLRTVGIPEARLTSAEQTHESNIAIVTEEYIGRRISGIDGMITALKKVPLAIFTADCLSIYIYCPDKKIISLLHAGWRGTAGRIVLKALVLLQDDWGANLKKAKVIFGPYIHSCCYRVKWHPVVEKIKDGLDGEDQFRSYCRNLQDDLWMVDLGGINRYYLERAGVPKQNFCDMGICTYEDQSTFSFRREGINAGRMMSLLMLE